ncbi:ferrochelatase [Candidatus Regiella endosymbiont of Tuberolachnus salignus]|uniref:ferrochelatase n=1 Tax=Candidatus Regiella endosymbiont of Tuberolachnus salignus TaxID=3077956 RepID=UPI0030CF286B
MHNKVGVLMVNLGTPDMPTVPAIKRYLAQFLSDHRVIDRSPWLWWPLLHAVILPFRAPRLAKLYQSIWMEEGSPLLVYSQRQQKALAARLPDIPVELGMSYGSPCLAKAIKTLLSHDLTKLIILPLYPQYSATTSAAAWDAVANILKSYRRLPSIQFIRDYAEHPTYIHALKQSVERSFNQHGQPDKLMLSFHGIPKRYAKLGDDYPHCCEHTFRALSAALTPWSEDKMIMAYQSRFGREPWLMPYTDKTLKKLPAQGVKHIQVICPGFAADCLETLEEIKQQNRGIFLKAGGEKFEYIPALNDQSAHIDLLQQLVAENIL